MDFAVLPGFCVFCPALIIAEWARRAMPVSRQKHFLAIIFQLNDVFSEMLAFF